MCDPVVTPVVGEALLGEAILGEVAAPMFIDALGVGEALAGAGELTGALGGLGGAIGATEAASAMGAGIDALGWGGMAEGIGGLDALGAIAGAGMGGATMPSIASQWATLEGTPTLTMGGDAAAGGLGAFTSDAGFQGAPQFVDDAISGTWYPQNMQQAGDMLGISRPVQGALGTANKVRGLYNAASGLNNMLNPPERPRTVSGLQPTYQPQPRGGLSRSFGQPMSNSIRGI